MPRGRRRTLPVAAFSSNKTDVAMERLAAILRKANYQGTVVLEYEEAHPFEEISKYLKQLQQALS